VAAPKEEGTWIRIEVRRRNELKNKNAVATPVKLTCQLLVALV
jgi:hypothetical protein